jgi:hypothetical protein
MRIKRTQNFVLILDLLENSQKRHEKKGVSKTAAKSALFGLLLIHCFSF